MSRRRGNHDSGTFDSGGAEPASSSTRVYRVAGLDCAEEARALRGELARLSNVQRIDIDLLNARLTVEFDPRRLSPNEIIGAILRAGLAATPWDAVGDLKRGPSVHLVMTALAGMSMAIAVGFSSSSAWGRGSLAAVLFYLVTILCSYVVILPRALLSARRLRPDMYLLMTVAVAGAIFIGEWFEAAAVAFLFCLSLLIESWSVTRARRAVAALLSVAPDEATLLHEPGDAQQTEGEEGKNGGDRPLERRVRASEVAVGSRVLVKTGEKVPLDGRILRGETHIDQSPITGESIPVPKTVGDEVFAGSVNQEGAIEVQTTRPADDSTLARITRLVGEAQSRRSPSEQFVDRFARVYTPAVMALAVLTFVAPPLLFGGDWGVWLYKALVLLVIACPCALVISTPVSVVSAMAAAARQGVLVKGGQFIEAPAHLKCVALDKTGTLTEGRPRVRSTLPLNDHTENELIEIAAAMEARSEHPLAQAILNEAKERELSPSPADGFTAIAGRGAKARIGEREYWIGSHRLLEERGQETPAFHRRIEELAGEGVSVVVVGTTDHVCGVITIADRLRARAATAIDALRRVGVTEVTLLTGDNRPTAMSIATALGIEDVRAEMLPEEKVRSIEELVTKHGTVAMIGDGVNDAPAMARATLGVAMGAEGTDAAIETADVVIVSSDLTRLPWLIAHSRKTGAVIRQNIIASLGTKGAFLLLAYGGWATLWAAIAADIGVSLAVIANGLRLLRSADPSAGSANDRPESEARMGRDARQSRDGR